MHHFFLKFDNLSVKIEYNAVGVDYTARQIGLITRPALTGRAFFIPRKEILIWQLVIRSFGNYLSTKI
jgi:hypothetical protein